MHYFKFGSVKRQQKEAKTLLRYGEKTLFIQTGKGHIAYNRGDIAPQISKRVLCNVIAQLRNSSTRAVIAGWTEG